MKTKEDLRSLLLSIDHRGYPAYKETRGAWKFESHILSIDHVQGDPFASPSRVSVIVDGRLAGFPAEYFREEHRRIALQDFLLRLFARQASGSGRAGSGKSGLVATSRPGQEVLERTACRIHPGTGTVTLRLEIGFPANGRTINAKELIRILFDFLPGVVKSTLYCKNLSARQLEAVMDLADDRRAIRETLPSLGLCAFVADGSILPRESGVSQRPMRDAVPFRSPESLAVELELPHRGKVRGMGIRRGVTLIVGGGYHGKSTLLQALERGVYDHIAGDGREFVITDPTAVKVRAEDGRSVRGTDISLFIRDLPNKKDTVHFMTEDASGSTSQAAGVAEALEAGSRLLLMDEDTSATNFMVRDELMARVVLREKEPITPFLSRIRDLYETSGVSTILVAGSSGAFFYVADTILQMDHYVPADITAPVKRLLQEEPAPENTSEGASVFRAAAYTLPDFSRRPRPNPELMREDRIKIKTLSEEGFLLNHDQVDLRGLEQLADREQVQTLAYILKYMELHILDGKLSLREAVARMETLLREKSLEELFDGSCIGSGLCQVRTEEIFGTLNRYRKL